MADKAVIHLRTIRQYLVLAAVVTTMLAAFATWLNANGEMSGAWHRLTLQLAIVSWFAVIAVACTVLCITTMDRRCKILEKRYAEHERRMDNATQAYMSAAVCEAVDRVLLAQSDPRR